jgi:hypothetical protein
MNQNNKSYEETNDLENEGSDAVDAAATEGQETGEGEEGAEEGEGEATDGSKSIVARHYQLSYQKSAFSSSRHSGSTLAQALDGYAPDDVVKAITQQIPEIAGKWANLNPGQRRMNAGNAAMHRLKKGEFNIDVLIDALVDCPRGKPTPAPKAAKPVEPVSETAPETVLGEDGKETKASKAAKRKWNEARKAAVRAEVDAKAAKASADKAA